MVSPFIIDVQKPKAIASARDPKGGLGEAVIRRSSRELADYGFA